MTMSENQKSQCVLELTHDAAREHFLKGENYCTIKLPKYFTFNGILSFLDEKIRNKGTERKEGKPRNVENVNHTILSNKDGKYAWRPLQIINPVLYVELVHLITREENWKRLQDRFKEFSKNAAIKCLSLPRKSLSKNTDKAQTISAWWEDVEQRSIALALDYSCITHTDIKNCYGSIYTHSVAWAIHGKQNVKKNRSTDDFKNWLGNKIDSLLRDMCHGQTNGIPQGSVLMDFIAEMVLGYADLELIKFLENQTIGDYKILRYRDDYRIFSHSPKDNDAILKCLTEVLFELGMQIHDGKTKASSSVIQGSIKSDKLFWIKQKQAEKDLQKHLLIIHDLSTKFPNCGQLVRALTDFYSKVDKRKELKNKENIPVLISIVTDIAHKNPRVYPQAAAIISLFLKFEDDPDQKKDLLEKVIKKFNDIPNTGELDIWIQRITWAIQKSNPYFQEREFREKLCQQLTQAETTIWNFSWVSDDLATDLSKIPIVDPAEIDKLSEIIQKDEIELFLGLTHNAGHS